MHKATDEAFSVCVAREALPPDFSALRQRQRADHPSQVQPMGTAGALPAFHAAELFTPMLCK